MNSTWNRRCFLNLTVLSTTGLVFGASCSTLNLKGKPDIKDYDVIICGGGTAGFPAAVAAARHGAKVAIIERYGFLGGNPAISIMPAWHRMGHSHSGILTEFGNRVAEFGVGPNPMDPHGTSAHIEPEVVKILFQTMVTENGIDIYLHHFISEVVKKRETVKQVITISKSGRRIFNAKMFIDTTGDGDVGALAGAAYHLGENGKMQGMALRFRIGYVDINCYLDWANEHLQYYRGRNKAAIEAIRERYNRGKDFVLQSDASQVWENDTDPELPRNTYFVVISLRPNEVSVNATRIYDVDGTNADDLTKAEIITRKQAWAIWRYMKKNVRGFENSVITETAPQIGVRESRKITGKYVLTSDDCEVHRRFDDTVMHFYAHYNLHDKNNYVLRSVRGHVDVPYRCFLPVAIDGLITSGRMLSTDRLTNSAIRIMESAFRSGQVAGTEAALSIKNNVTPAELNVKTLQSRLLSDGFDITINS